MMFAFIRPRQALVIGAGLVACLGALACKSNREGAAITPDSTRATSAGGRTAPKLTDAEIADIALTANSADSAAGAMARGKAGDAEVRAFAASMIHDHGALNQKIVALTHKLGLTPQVNDDSRDMRHDADNQVNDLRGEDRGIGFDKKYIKQEVDDHKKVLDDLDHTLIPNAQNAELKDLLTQARAAVANHLERAMRIQDRLNGTTRP